MTTQTRAAAVAHDQHDEQILVVKRTHLFTPDAPAWHGIKNSKVAMYVDLIYQQKEFQPRRLMELDQAYKQIIPYMVFQYENRYFLMQRTSTTSEQRLKNLYSLGIGGHVQEQDVVGFNLIDWARREFHEEISYNSSFSVTTIGILNDDTNDVGKVHLGLVLLLQGTSDEISIKSELKSGKLVTLAECRAHYDQLESWSKCVVDVLEQQEGIIVR